MHLLSTRLVLLDQKYVSQISLFSNLSLTKQEVQSIEVRICCLIDMAFVHRLIIDHSQDSTHQFDDFTIQIRQKNWTWKLGRSKTVIFNGRKITISDKKWWCQII